jgi:hypothetical protein
MKIIDLKCDYGVYNINVSSKDDNVAGGWCNEMRTIDLKCG